MLIFNNTQLIKKHLIECRKKDIKISFVATMGGLHQGHMQLVDKAKSCSDIVVVSIFVNPTQFLANEDFDKYYRNPKADEKFLSKKQVDILFLPTIDQIYTKEQYNDYEIGSLGKILCAKSRPSHFQGVVQVMSIMFDIIQPDIAIFGEKDYQQLQIISQLVKTQKRNIEIISVAIIRDSKGLAISTRNKYLNSNERKIANNFNYAIQNAKASYEKGLDLNYIISEAKIYLNKYFDCEYFEILDAKNLAQISNKTVNIIIISAIKLGQNRLIDNIIFKRLNFLGD